LSGASGGRSLEINDKLHQDIHSLDKSANVAGVAVFDRQVTEDLVASGDKVPTVVSDKFDQIIARKHLASGFVVSKWVYTISSWTEVDAIPANVILIWFCGYGYLPMMSELSRPRPCSAVLM
jgi:hypothetical protein